MEKKKSLSFFWVTRMVITGFYFGYCLFLASCCCCCCYSFFFFSCCCCCCYGQRFHIKLESNYGKVQRKCNASFLTHTSSSAQTSSLLLSSRNYYETSRTFAYSNLASGSGLDLNLLREREKTGMKLCNMLKLLCW